VSGGRRGEDAGTQKTAAVRVGKAAKLLPGVSLHWGCVVMVSWWQPELT